jgi:hypothetical protein
MVQIECLIGVFGPIVVFITVDLIANIAMDLALELAGCIAGAWEWPFGVASVPVAVPEVPALCLVR